MAHFEANLHVMVHQPCRVGGGLPFTGSQSDWIRVGYIMYYVTFAAYTLFPFFKVALALLF